MDAQPLGILQTVGRLLTFRLREDEFVRLDRRHLAFGLGATWLAGIGRYWDHPDAHVLQVAGLGSVIYVVVLSLFLWLLIAPLRPANWKWVRVLTFVTLTAPPALLYAIPVERFMPMPEAQQANMWFLLAVASWRVALLLFCLRRMAKLPIPWTIVATLLPLALIVIVLAIANLEHVVFSVMAGNPGQQHESSADAAYAVVFVLAVLSFLTGPVLALAYLGGIIRRNREAPPESPPPASDPRPPPDTAPPPSPPESP